MKNDSFILGVVIGVITPIIAYLLTTYTSIQQSLFVEKPIALYLIAAVINLIIIRFAFKGALMSFAKGIVFATFLAMTLLIFTTGLKV